jgi:hypothetical protein
VLHLLDEEHAGRLLFFLPLSFGVLWQLFRERPRVKPEYRPEVPLADLTKELRFFGWASAGIYRRNVEHEGIRGRGWRLWIDQPHSMLRSNTSNPIDAFSLGYGCLSSSHGLASLRSAFVWQSAASDDQNGKPVSMFPIVSKLSTCQLSWEAGSKYQNYFRDQTAVFRSIAARKPRSWLRRDVDFRKSFQPSMECNQNFIHAWVRDQRG